MARFRAGVAVAAMMAACSGGTGDVSPEAVCDHVIEVSRKTGEKTPDDNKAHCLERQGQLKTQLGDERYKIFAACVKGKSDIPSIYIHCDPEKLPGKSKSTEARMQMKKLYEGARMYYLDAIDRGEPTPPQFPEPSAGPTPPVGSCCKGLDGHCAPSIAQWEGEPWRSLKFSMDEPHRYSYEYKVDNAGKTFTVAAYGDLDCNGAYSTYTMTGSVQGDAPASTAEPKTTNEPE